MRKLRKSLYHPSGEVYALGGQELSNPLKNAYVSGRMGKVEMVISVCRSRIAGVRCFWKEPGQHCNSLVRRFRTTRSASPPGGEKIRSYGFKIMAMVAIFGRLGQKVLNKELYTLVKCYLL